MRSCVRLATVYTMQRCSHARVARIGVDRCTVQLSDHGSHPAHSALSPVDALHHAGSLLIRHILRLLPLQLATERSRRERFIAEKQGLRKEEGVRSGLGL